MCCGCHLVVLMDEFVLLSGGQLHQWFWSNRTSGEHRFRLQLGTQVRKPQHDSIAPVVRPAAKRWCMIELSLATTATTTKTNKNMFDSPPAKPRLAASTFKN